MRMTRSLLLKFSRNECTDEEVSRIRQWLEDSTWPDFPQDIELPDEIRQEVWERLHEKLRINKPVSKIRKLRHNLVKIAAIALVLLGTAAFFLYQSTKTQTAIVYTTGNQEHQKIILPDSSMAFLAPNSTLTMSQHYGQEDRTLQLKGEAVFEVAQNATSPFTVITGKIATTALGTSFKVRSFPGENINIALSYGKIVVKNEINNDSDNVIFLSPGEEVVYNQSSHTLKKTDNTSRLFDYRHNILYFKNASVNEVIDKIERYYQVKVKYDALKQADWKVSGEFDYQPLEVVMKAIAYSCSIEFEIRGDELILTPSGSASPK